MALLMRAIGALSRCRLLLASPGLACQGYTHSTGQEVRGFVSLSPALHCSSLRSSYVCLCHCEPSWLARGALLALLCGCGRRWKWKGEKRWGNPGSISCLGNKMVSLKVGGVCCHHKLQTLTCRPVGTETTQHKNIFTVPKSCSQLWLGVTWRSEAARDRAKPKAGGAGSWVGPGTLCGVSSSARHWAKSLQPSEATGKSDWAKAALQLVCSVSSCPTSCLTLFVSVL